ncbi:unnamed protein product, partial [Heterosigma akashiwo]
AKQGFEPLLQALRHRATHIMRRLFPLARHMMMAEGLTLADPYQRPFNAVLEKVYTQFVDETIDNAIDQCRYDLKAITRFVTWDLHERGTGALQRSLPDNQMVEIYSMVMGRGRDRGIEQEWEAATNQEVAPSTGISGRDYGELIQLMEEATTVRDSRRTHAVVTCLVQHVTRAWRANFGQQVATKFNCFFLMPFIDELPFYLRTELDRIYQNNVEELFDVTRLRASLEAEQESLRAEFAAHKQLQEKFDLINDQLEVSNERDLFATAPEDDLELEERAARSRLAAMERLEAEREGEEEEEFYDDLADLDLREGSAGVEDDDLLREGSSDSDMFINRVAIDR